MVEDSIPVAVKTSDFTSLLSKELFQIHATIECGITLKPVRHMVITYSQMYSNDK